jgi:predicted nuclease of predicted toxin-antitoxin system
MLILADENCDRTIVIALREAGHDVTSITDAAPGLSDDGVLALAKSEHRILITHDHDFGMLAERAHERPPAIVLMRLSPLSSARRARAVVKTFEALGDKIMNRFVVVEPERVRDRAYKF